MDSNDVVEAQFNVIISQQNTINNLSRILTEIITNKNNEKVVVPEQQRFLGKLPWNELKANLELKNRRNNASEIRETIQIHGRDSERDEAELDNRESGT